MKHGKNKPEVIIMTAQEAMKGRKCREGRVPIFYRF
jgi:hypothetical protein